MDDVDICSHPVCLIAFTGGYVDPDDTPRLRRRLRQRGFSTEQQDEIVYELQWAWIEQSMTMTDYVTSGYWGGHSCHLHGPMRINKTRRRHQKQRHRNRRRRSSKATPSEQPISAHELSLHDSSRLAVAAECVVLSATVDAQYISEAEDIGLPSMRATEPPSTPSSHSTHPSVSSVSSI